jgi:AraC-like DNA-binding protein
MPKRLTTGETDRAIRSLGINARRASMLGIFDEARNVRYEFHRHRRHQLIFPSAGLLFVETDRAIHPCSPQQGLWIPAGVRHATTTGLHTTVSVFLPPAAFSALRKESTPVTITPLLREAGNRIATAGKSSAALTAALSAIVHAEVRAGFSDTAWPSLPVARSLSMQRAIGIALDDLESITVAGLAVRGGQSERTLRRKFAEELGMGPELFLLRARLIRGMHLLATDHKGTITEIALAAGYSNHSAFSSAFRRFTGVSPHAFRSRVARAENSRNSQR